MVLEDLRRPLRQRLSTVEGLLSLALSDVDGVLVLRVSTPEQKVANKVENVVASMAYLSSFSTALEQCERLDQGAHRMMAVKFEHFQVVHFYQHRLILTLIGTHQARLGPIRQLAQDLAPLIQDIAHTVIKD